MNTPTDLCFGALAVKNGYATSSEVDLALEAQKENPSPQETPLKLGAILLEMGTLTEGQVQTLLETQTRLRGSTESARLAPEPPPEPQVRFEEIEPPTLIQESGPPILINDLPLAAGRTLKSGDRLRAGEVVLQFRGESIELRPKPAAPLAASPAAPADIPAIMPAEPAPAPSASREPAPSAPLSSATPSAETSPAAPAAADPASATPEAKPGILSRILPVLRSIDGLVARIPPAFHTQRKYVLASAVLCWLTLILPWRIAGNGNSVLGLQGPGWLPALLALVPAALTLFTRASEPFTKPERWVASGAAGLALVALLLKFAFPPAYAVSRGFGLIGCLLATLALLAAGAFARAGGTGAGPESGTLGAKLWKRLHHFAGSVSGRRAKELTLAIEQRDQCLRKLGEAALAAHRNLPEAAAAIQAQEALAKAEKDAALSEPTGGQVRARAAQKAADAKAKRALGKVAQRALEGGLPLPGQEAVIADLRAAEARIKELG